MTNASPSTKLELQPDEVVRVAARPFYGFVTQPPPAHEHEAPEHCCMQPPPAQDMLVPLPAALFCRQPLPAHSNVHFAPFAQFWRQFPPLQRNVHVEPVSHCCEQLPCSQSSVQVPLHRHATPSAEQLALEASVEVEESGYPPHASDRHATNRR
jgi:hypothetical protein